MLKSFKMTQNINNMHFLLISCVSCEHVSVRKYFYISTTKNLPIESMYLLASAVPFICRDFDMISQTVLLDYTQTCKQH